MELKNVRVWMKPKFFNRRSRAEGLARELEVEKEWYEQALVDMKDFGNIYVKYRLQIFQFIRSKTTDADAANDLTNETFLRAMTKLDSFRWQQIPIKRWLFGIARNVVRQEAQKIATRAEIPFDPIKHDTPAGRTRLRSATRFASMAAYLRKLDGPQRLILMK